MRRLGKSSAQSFANCDSVVKVKRPKIPRRYHITYPLAAGMVVSNEPGALFSSIFDQVSLLSGVMFCFTGQEFCWFLSLGDKLVRGVDAAAPPRGFKSSTVNYFLLGYQDITRYIGYYEESSFCIGVWHINNDGRNMQS